MRNKIGTLRDGKPVSIAENSPNNHIAIFGMSGTGKSTRIGEILMDLARNGETAIVFDINGMDFQFLSQYVNRISAVDDGLDMKFLNTASVDSGLESRVNFVSYLVETLTSSAELGIRQVGAMREAIQYAIDNQTEYGSEMEAISQALKRQSTSVAKGVYNKCWNVLESNVFRKSNKFIQKGRINIISFMGLNPSTQKQLIEIVLRSLWKMLRLGFGSLGPVTMVLDEFQNLSLKKNSVLMEMLREGRKYDVQMILSTQTCSSFSKDVMAALNQSAVNLYFRPSHSDAKKIADAIEPQRPEYWILALKGLRVGQAIAVGDLSINGKKCYNPVLSWPLENSFEMNKPVSYNLLR